MKKAFVFCFLLVCVSSASAFTWSAEEYVANCSVVHNDKFTMEDREKIAHCIGITKGALAGIATTRFLYDGDPETIYACIPAMLEGNSSMFDVQKDVNATIRLMAKNLDSAGTRQTAAAAVAMALMELYPCLTE
jgi:hypothetical protein